MDSEVTVQEHTILKKFGNDIKSVIKGEKNSAPISDNNQATVIVPMRLRNKHILGAFILSREGENYSGEEVAILDQFSNRLALLLNAVLQEDYASNAEDFRLKMVEENNDTNRQAIMASALEFLLYTKEKNGVASRKRFREEEVHLFLYDTSESDKLYHEINAGKLTYSSDQSERTPVSMDATDTRIPINQALASLVKEQNKPQILRSDAELKQYHLSPNRVAYLIEPVRIFDGRIIGYLVLTNPSNKNAYDDDTEILDRLSNYIGSALRRQRDRLRERALNKYRLNLLNPDELEKTTDEERYKKIHKLITQVICERPLYIVTFDRKAQKLKSVYPHNQNSADGLPDDIRAIVIDYIDGNRTIVEAQNGYLLAPMKTMNQVHGCFILKIDNLGSSDRSFLDRLSDLLAFEQKLLRSQERTRLTVDFSYEINKLSDDKQIALDDALKLVKNYTSRVMSTDNMFIALRDDAASLHYGQSSKGEPWLRFPLFIKNGKTLEKILESDPSTNNPERLWNPDNSSRTEVIMTAPNRENAPMLCRTKAEAEAYYETRSNPLGDTLASFLGVPIYLDNIAVGVIAVYHPDKDDCFNYNDQRFLESLAGHVSGLLRLVREKEANQKLEEAILNNTALKESNKKLEEANDIIAGQENIFTTALLAQDLSHRINNSAGSISINISEAIRDIKTSLKSSNTKYLENTIDWLRDSLEVINELINEVKEISSSEKQLISLNQVLEQCTQQAILTRKNHKVSIETQLDLSKNIPHIESYKRLVSNAFYTVIENAIESIIDEHEENSSNKIYKMRITSCFENNKIHITITDNGKEIPNESKENIFNFGVSTKGKTGYGLWRTRNILRNINGEIFLENKNSFSDEKTFHLIIGTQDDKLAKLEIKPEAIVIDDEKSWQRICARWLENMGYNVTVGSDRKSLEEIIENTTKPPAIAIIDISLEKKDGGNADGLVLLNIIKTKFIGTKTILFTGYAGSASAYTRGVDYDLLIEKVSENGPIDFDTFTNNIKEME